MANEVVSSLPAKTALCCCRIIGETALVAFIARGCLWLSFCQTSLACSFDGLDWGIECQLPRHKPQVILYSVSAGKEVAT